MSEQTTSQTHEACNPLTIRTSTQLGQLAEALAKAQLAFPAVKKDRRADTGSYAYNYADHASVVDAVRKPLGENELALLQPTGIADGQPVLVTLLLHSSGQWIEGVFPLKEYARPQDLGSALTYLKRYCATSMLNIATEDDDGAAASAPTKPAAARKPQAAATASGPTSLASAAQVNVLTAKAAERELAETVLFAHLEKEFGAKHPRELTKPQASAAIDWLKKATDQELDALVAKTQDAAQEASG